MASAYFLLFSAFFVGIIHGAEINYQFCAGRENNTKSIINSVDVTPCDAAPDGPCRVVVGQSARIAINFKPTVELKAVRYGIYWNVNPPLPLKTKNSKACGKTMNCKLGANVSTTFNVTVPLKSSFPPNLYPVKIKLYKGNTTFTCAVVQIHLV